MGDARPLNDLRSQYRSVWDAYQIVAHRNVVIRNRGGKPTAEQLAEERAAAKTVELARDEMLGAMPRLGH